MTSESGREQRFAVGMVIRAGLAITFNNLFRFTAILLVIAIPAVILSAIARLLLSSGTVERSGGTTINFGTNASAVVFLVIAALIAMLAYLLIQAAIVQGTLEVLRGRSPRIGPCLSRALAAWPQLLLAGLLMFVGGGVLAGTIGFVLVQLLGGGGAATGGNPEGAKQVLGILSLVITVMAIAVVALVWVFVPAIVAERAGPIACFKRSAVLTQGRRWSIVGIVLMVSLANVLVSVLTQTLMASGAPLGGAVLNGIAALFFMLLSAVLSAVGYAALRAEKEGSTIGDVAARFD